MDRVTKDDINPETAAELLDLPQPDSTNADVQFHDLHLFAPGYGHDRVSAYDLDFKDLLAIGRIKALIAAYEPLAGENPEDGYNTEHSQDASSQTAMPKSETSEPGGETAGLAVSSIPASEGGTFFLLPFSAWNDAPFQSSLSLLQSGPGLFTSVSNFASASHFYDTRALERSEVFLKTPAMRGGLPYDSTPYVAASAAKQSALVNLAPEARYDFFWTGVNQTLTGNLLHDNGYGVDSDPEGHAVHTIAGTYATLRGGSVQLLSNGSFTYTPSTNYVGADSFSYSIVDDHGALTSTTASFALSAVNNHVSIDFSSATFRSYDGTNNVSNLYAVEDGGDTLHVSGNTWISVDLAYTVRAGTYIEFDFRSTEPGEVHAIGFDNDATGSDIYAYELYGTQIWGLQGQHNYEGNEGNWVHYTIQVGANYTGTFNRLFFVNDDDFDNSAHSYFRNVEIYGGNVTSVDLGAVSQLDYMNFTGATLRSYGITQDLNVKLAQATGNQVEIFGNTWKSVDFTYTVTENTVMQFDFRSPARRELHGIGLDTDVDHNTSKFIQVYGSDVFGQDGPDYSGAGQFQTFAVRLSNFYASGTTYNRMTFVADDDASANARSVFSNIIVYERGSAGTDLMQGTAQGQNLLGLAGDDLIYAGGGNDRLYGGAGTDFLYGEGGADHFVFEAGSAFGAVDHIMDFSLTDGDALDIADILSGYDPITDLIAGFVRLTERNGDTTIAVDADGGGDHYIDIAILHGVTGLGSADLLEDSGALITV